MFIEMFKIMFNVFFIKKNVCNNIMFKRNIYNNSVDMNIDIHKMFIINNNNNNNK
jgi:hypothetical protein